MKKQAKTESELKLGPNNPYHNERSHLWQITKENPKSPVHRLLTERGSGCGRSLLRHPPCCRASVPLLVEKLSSRLPKPLALHHELLQDLKLR